MQRNTVAETRGESSDEPKSLCIADPMGGGSMIEILLLLVLIALAKRKGGGRRRRRYLKGNLHEGLALATLAGQTLVSDVWDETVVERTLISSIVATWTIKDLTGVAGDGPIVVGVAHSDYSDAEIEQVIENTGSWDEGDLVQQEVAKRKVRTIGIFSEFSGDVNTFTLNDGLPIKTKLNWMLTTGDTLKMWAFNQGSGALTTGANMSCIGHANLWPQ